MYRFNDIVITNDLTTLRPYKIFPHHSILTIVLQE